MGSELQALPTLLSLLAAVVQLVLCNVGPDQPDQPQPKTVSAGGRNDNKNAHGCFHKGDLHTE